MCEKVYQLLFAIIKVSPEHRHRVLQWLGKCINANLGRTKIWSSQMPQLFTQMYASEGFCLNLCSIMLRLCKPFSEPRSAKLLKIQPTYCRMVAANEKEAREKGMHAEGEKRLCKLSSMKNVFTVVIKVSFMWIILYHCFNFRTTKRDLFNSKWRKSKSLYRREL